jgi:hypothetical protein
LKAFKILRNVSGEFIVNRSIADHFIALQVVYCYVVVYGKEVPSDT